MACRSRSRVSDWRNRRAPSRSRTPCDGETGARGCRRGPAAPDPPALPVAASAGRARASAPIDRCRRARAGSDDRERDAARSATELENRSGLRSREPAPERRRPAARRSARSPSRRTARSRPIHGRRRGPSRVGSLPDGCKQHRVLDLDERVGRGDGIPGVLLDRLQVVRPSRRRDSSGALAIAAVTASLRRPRGAAPGARGETRSPERAAPTPAGCRAREAGPAPAGRSARPPIRHARGQER